MQPVQHHPKLYLWITSFLTLRFIHMFLFLFSLMNVGQSPGCVLTIPLVIFFHMDYKYLYVLKMCVTAITSYFSLPVLHVPLLSLIFRFLLTGILLLIFVLTASRCLSLPIHAMPHKRRKKKGKKIRSGEFRVPCFLIWWSASWPEPLLAHDVSEARAQTGRRRSPFASIFGSEFNKNHREGRGKWERRDVQGEGMDGGGLPPSLEAALRLADSWMSVKTAARPHYLLIIPTLQSLISRLWKHTQIIFWLS